MSLFSKIKNKIPSPRKCIKYVLCAIPVTIIVILITLELISRSAGAIFNYAMSEQTMFVGTITCEKIFPHINGRVEYENLDWRDKDGHVLLHIPEGNFRVRVWDIVTRNIKTTTMQEFTMKGAVVSLRLNEEMELDMVENSKPHPAEKKKRVDWKKEVGFNEMDEAQRQAIINERYAQMLQKAKEEENNLNLDEEHHVKTKIKLEGCSVEIFYLNRHYLLSNVNVDLDADSEKFVKINATTGRFGGTLIGQGISINGSIDLTQEPEPTVDLKVFLQNVNLDSMGVGVKLDNNLTMWTHFTGPISMPDGQGKLYMDQLIMPNVKFTDIRGDVHYNDGILKFLNVNANVYDGKLKARGYYNVDTLYYHIWGHGEGLDSGVAFPDMKLECPVAIDIAVHGCNIPKRTVISGVFYSGPGSYNKLIHFDRLSGKFSSAHRDLLFESANIAMGSYNIATDSFRIQDGQLSMDPLQVLKNGAPYRTYPAIRK